MNWLELCERNQTLLKPIPTIALRSEPTIELMSRYWRMSSEIMDELRAMGDNLNDDDFPVVNAKVTTMEYFAEVSRYIQNQLIEKGIISPDFEIDHEKIEEEKLRKKEEIAKGLTSLNDPEIDF